MVATENSNLELPSEVSLFLRKTYHMIDSCDPAIAGWSEDGETFVIKDPSLFERQIIPQFFKHSKFSSFVRQLNFYSFRKIKYADTIRIDAKLEAETANYWRFRHENFRRGRPDLLTEIKRSNGSKNNASASGSSGSVPAAVKSDGGAASSSCVTDAAPSAEVQTLKKRIEEMSKNIDQLTAMVQKVSLKQEEQSPEVDVGSKRKKLDTSSAEADAEARPDAAMSNMALPEVAPSSMDLEEVAFPAASMASLSSEALPVLPPMMPMADREMSQVSDNEFVDQPFSAFGDEAEDLTDLPFPVNDNRPDPELMQRLSDALMLLPRDVQEMIVDKLIAAITSNDLIATPVTPAPGPKKVATKSKAVPSSPTSSDDEDDGEEEEVEERKEEPSRAPVNMPMAAATLAALLQHYSHEVQNKKPKSVQKSIPVIPVHA